MTVRLAKCCAATDHEIAEAEARLRLTFPSDYRTFLKRYNAGTPDPNFFGADRDVSVERFIRVSEIATCLSSIDGFPAGAFPIADAGGGNFVYLKKGSSGVFFSTMKSIKTRNLRVPFPVFWKSCNRMLKKLFGSSLVR